MKRFSILFLSILMISALSCKNNNNDDDDDNNNASTDFVSKTAENKTAVLEEFTGVRCGYCPDGARIAAEMVAEHPGKAISIAVHGGSYSTPYSGDPDLTSSWSAAFRSWAGVTGFPSGMVQRRDHDNDGQISCYRSTWKSIANTVVTEAAPVNVGIQSSVSGTTASIKVQVYYTADGGGANLLNVAICEDGIQTQQSGDPDPSTPYTHAHVLRDLVTGQWGASIATTTVGTMETYEYTYTLKAGEVAANCSVVAYITKGDKTEILNANSTHLVNGSTK